MHYQQNPSVFSAKTAVDALKNHVPTYKKGVIPTEILDSDKQDLALKCAKARNVVSAEEYARSCDSSAGSTVDIGDTIWEKSGSDAWNLVEFLKP